MQADDSRYFLEAFAIGMLITSIYANEEQIAIVPAKVENAVKTMLEASAKLLIDLDDVSSECMKITGVVRMLNHKIKKESYNFV